MYNIHCVVQGGVTGRREALLKSNGEVQVFVKEEVAKAEARRLNEQANGPYATASFRYTVIPA